MTATSPPGRRRLRRAGLVLVALVLAVGAVVLSLSFFSARDKAAVQVISGPGTLHPDRGDRVLPPGRRASATPASDPPTSGPHARVPVTADERRLSDDQVLTALAAGNVVVLYGGARPPASLRSLASSVAGGPFDAPLAETGQAVILARRPGIGGAVALAWRHSLAAPPAAVRDLRAFAEFWLGRGAGG